MAGIVLKDICKVYPGRDKRSAGGVMAVKNFSMEIEDNEFIVFVGPSGCGKSTTLRMIAGLEEISSGELYIDGEYMNDSEPKNRDISMVFQNYALYPHMTAYKNIAFGLTLRKVAVPVYEENETTARQLEEIRRLQAERKAVYQNSLSIEKSLAPLEKKRSARQRSLEAVLDETEELNGRKARTKKVQDKLAGLAGARKELEAEISRLEEEISGLEAKMAEGRRQIAGNEKHIEEIRGGLAVFQKKAIDEKAVQKQKKNIAYYEKLRQKDEQRRKKDEEELAAGEKKGESFPGELDPLREELEILEARKRSIEKGLKDSREKLDYYETTPQPVFTYRKYEKEEIDHKVKEAADILDINKLLTRKPREMSGGQRQRIALGRAIVREPKVFLLDEPLSNLDAKLRATMRVEISRLHEKLKTTFIYVTHDQVEAMTMGTRIVVMKDGIIQQIDTPTNLFDYPDNVFVAGFIGTPQMNFFHIKASVSGEVLTAVFDDGSRLDFDTKKMRRLHAEYCDGREYDCVLGVRGEDIEISAHGLPAVLGLTEILGNETHLHLSTEALGAEKEIIVNLRERVSYRVGERLYLNFGSDKIHLFDNETSMSILER